MPGVDTPPLHIRQLGPAEGSPVVMLHAGVVDGKSLMPVAHRIAATGFRVLVPDLRGWGASANATEPFSHVDDVIAAMDAAGIDQPAVVVGWSFGGQVACGIAVQAAARVRALALFNSVPPGFDRSPEVLEAWEREQALWDAGDIDGLVRNDLDVWIVGAGRSIDEVDDRVLAAADATARDQLARYVEGSEAHDQTGELTRSRVEALDIPMLLVDSEHDWPDNRAAAEALVAHRADSVRCETIGACAHAGPLERPDDYADALLEWLKSVEQ